MVRSVGPTGGASQPERAPAPKSAAKAPGMLATSQKARAAASHCNLSAGRHAIGKAPAKDSASARARKAFIRIQPWLRYNGQAPKA